jgi:hypothetical protein
MYCLQETQALLARLSQPSAAALHKEYDNCQRLTAFLNSDPLTTQFDQLTASQLSSTLLRWCTLAQPILQVIINQADQLTKFPAAFSAVGVLLNALGMCLESWVRQQQQRQQQTLKQQIAQQTAGERTFVGFKDMSLGARALGICVWSWVRQTAQGQQQALKQHITQQTAGEARRFV